MSGLTGLGFPYPQLTDDFDPPGDMQALAVAVDTEVSAIEDRPRYYGTFAATIANNTNTSLTPTTVDAVGGITAVGTVITVPAAGWYDIGVVIRWNSQTTTVGTRVGRFNVNSVDRGFFGFPTSTSQNSTNITSAGVSRLLLAAGDQIVVQAFHTAGASLALVTDSYVWIERIVQ